MSVTPKIVCDKYIIFLKFSTKATSISLATKLKSLKWKKSSSDKTSYDFGQTIVQPNERVDDTNSTVARLYLSIRPAE